MEISTADAMGMDPKEYRSTGMIFLILGFIGMIFPIFMSTFAVYMMGFLLIIGGIVFAFVGDRSAWFKWLLAILFFILGMVVIINPYYSIAAVGLLMAMFFLITGFSALAVGVMNFRDGGWMMVLNGIISLFLSGMVLAGWPEDSVWMVGLFLGIYLIFEGVALMAIGKQMGEQGGATT